MSEEAQKMGVTNMAFIRVEQLYPLPKKQIMDVIAKYSNAKNILWAQEEPENMGAWRYMAMQLREINLIGISRRASAAAAEGSSSLHKRRLKLLMESVFKYAKVAVK